MWRPLPFFFLQRGGRYLTKRKEITSQTFFQVSNHSMFFMVFFFFFPFPCNDFFLSLFASCWKQSKDGRRDRKKKKKRRRQREYINKTVGLGWVSGSFRQGRWGYSVYLCVCVRVYSIVTVAMETHDSISGLSSSSDQISQDNNPMLSACV